ncbi:hypothetical protein E4665_07785 [Sporolactobacillus shoreae]|uniref:ABC transporter ATP-binding protein n=1 Tax=Sporolactobacillus shoreae TaxID=1465501 RepID=A0A4Z0GP66_9BACL|nr:hypothetical protein [Sporolactobacillus shoreae]TGA98421.1 hypothetical protein E4665_07785 [Sporolactobacillus shoreae]
MVGVLTFSASILVPFGSIPQAHAATPPPDLNQPVQSNPSVSTGNLDSALILEADPFISLQGHKYVIVNKQGLLNLVGNQNYTSVLDMVSRSNANISESTAPLYTNANEKALTTVNESTGKFTALASSSNGITKVQYYWWGLRFWLSKSLVKNLLSLSTGLAVVLLTAETGVGAALAGVVCIWLMDNYISPKVARALIIDQNMLLGGVITSVRFQ